METNFIVWILFSMTFATAMDTRSGLFHKILRVSPQHHGTNLISSIVGTKTRKDCAMLCVHGDCASFSYTEDEKTCNTYTSVFTEDFSATVSMTTTYFNKVKNECSGAPYGSAVVETRSIGHVMFSGPFVDKVDGNWFIIHRRFSGEVDFYGGWQQYKSGFGDLTGEFWFGNEKLYLLTTTPRVLRIELDDFNCNKVYAEYSHFQVSDEIKYYRLDISGFSGNVTNDAMAASSGMRFSTNDRDNDNNPYHSCVQRMHSPWWHRNCADINLNGRYVSSPSDPWNISFIAWNLLANDPRIKRIVMMVKV